MLPFLETVAYPLDRENWGKTFNPDDPETQTELYLNNHIALSILRYKHYKYTDNDLWEDFQGSFEGWTLEHLEKANRYALKELRTFLRTHGVWVKKQTGPISFAKTLIEVLLEETPYI